jgi:hypothetical protein
MHGRASSIATSGASRGGKERPDWLVSLTTVVVVSTVLVLLGWLLSQEITGVLFGGFGGAMMMSLDSAVVAGVVPSVITLQVYEEDGITADLPLATPNQTSIELEFNASEAPEDWSSFTIAITASAAEVLEATPEANETITPEPSVEASVEPATPTPQAGGVNVVDETITPTPAGNETNETITPTPAANETNETITPTPQATETPTPEPTPEITPTPQPAETPTPEPTPEPTPTPTPTPGGNFSSGPRAVFFQSASAAATVDVYALIDNTWTLVCPGIEIGGQLETQECTANADTLGMIAAPMKFKLVASTQLPKVLLALDAVKLGVRKLVLTPAPQATATPTPLPFDTEAPKWFENTTTEDDKSLLTTFSVFWVDNTSLSGFILEFDDGNGNFSNDSWTEMNGVANYSSRSKAVTANGTSRWRVFANDSYGNWNATDVFTFVSSEKLRKKLAKDEKKAVKRLRELVEKRSKFSRHFLNDDGSITAEISSGDLFFEENGQLVEIDTALEQVGQKLRTKANKVKGTFSGDLASPTDYEIEAGDARVEFKLVGARNSAIAASDANSVTYATAFANTDLKLTSTSAGIKEEIILNTVQAPTTFTYNINTRNLDAEQSGNDILFTDSRSSAPVFVAQAPFMTDAAGAFSNAVTMTLSGNGKRITVNADPIWLADAGRQYPVTIDPTIGLYINQTSTSDGHIGDDECPTYTRTTSGSTLSIGKSTMVPPCDTGPVNYRAWIIFNTTYIPSTSTINEVNLTAYVETGVGNNNCGIMPLDANASDYADNAAGNAAFFADMNNGTAYNYSNWCTSTGLKNVTLTAQALTDIQSVLTGNNLFRLGINSSQDGNTMVIGLISSSESATAAWKPRLIVRYTAGAPEGGGTVGSCQTVAYNGPTSGAGWNSLYSVNQSMFGASNCLTIGSANVTLDCAGYSIFYGQSNPGVGINFSATGWDNVTIKNCKFFQNSSSTGSPAIYLNGSGTGNPAGNLTLLNNAVMTTTSSSHAAVLTDIAGLTASANNYTTSGATSHGLILVNSTNATITSDVATVSATTSTGVFLNATNYTTFENLTVTYKQAGFNASNSRLTLMNNSVINTCSSGCASLTDDLFLGDSSNLTVKNTTFSQSVVAWGAGSGNNLTIQWYVRANASFDNGTLIPGARVNVSNASGLNTNPMYLNQVTDSSGLTSWLLITQSIGNAATNINYTPYNFSWFNLTYYNTTNFSLTSSQTVQLQYHGAYPTSQPTTVRFYTNTTGTSDGHIGIACDASAYIRHTNTNLNGFDVWSLACGASEESNFLAFLVFNVSTIPSGASISAANITIYLNPTTQAPRCAFNELNANVSAYGDNTAGNTLLWADINNGTLYNQSTLCKTASGLVNFTMNANALLNISSVAAGDDLFKVGFNVSGSGAGSLNGSWAAGDHATPGWRPYLDVSYATAQPPQWSNNRTDGAQAGQSTKFIVNWTDDIQLMNYSFEFDNGNGTFYNVTVNAALNGTVNQTNMTAVLNSTPGATLRWRVYVWDNEIAMNVTPIFTLTTTNAYAISGCQALSYRGAQDGWNSLYQLNTSVANNANCFAFTTSNVTLDCGGYNIFYAQAGPGMGANFSTTGLDNITVRGCNFWENGTASTASSGIFFNGSPSTLALNLTIYNNSFRTNSLRSVGVQVATANQTNITGNTFTANGSTAHAINLTNSTYSWIATNVMTTNASNAYGIFVLNSNFSNITSNVINTNTSTGIYFAAYAVNQNVSKNTIVTNGTSSNGIQTVTAFGFLNVSENTIDLNGTAAYAVIFSGSNQNLFIQSNTLRTNSSGNPISVASTANANITGNTLVARGTAAGISAAASVNVTGNSITTWGGGSGFASSNGMAGGWISGNTIVINGSGNGISLSAISNVIISNNTIYTNSTSNNGISVSWALGGNANNRIDNNVIISNGTSAVGIREVDGTNVNVSFNYIKTSGTQGYGIYVSGTTTQNFVNFSYNNILTNGSYAHGIYISSVVAKVNFTGNTILTNGTGAYGVLIEKATSVNFTNTTIASRGGALAVNGSASIQFVNGSITPCTSGCDAAYFDLNLSGNSGLRLLNTTFNRSAVTWGAGTGNNLTLDWYARANVTWTNSTPIVGALVNITNATNPATNPMFANLVAGTDGATPWWTVTQFFGNNTVNTSFTPHNFTAYNLTSGAISNFNSTNATINSSQTAWITMSSITHTNCDSLAYRGTEEGLNSLYTLSADIAASANCFTITTSNVTLDCLGHRVYYGQAGPGMGVNFSTTGLDNVTIRGCNFISNNSAASNSPALYFNGTAANKATNLTLFNNSIVTNGAGASGIYLNNTLTVNISKSSIYTNGASAHAVNVTNSSSLTISNNTITTNATGAYGVYLQTTNNTNLSSNVFILNTSTAAYIHQGYLERIALNTININGSISEASNGILLSSSFASNVTSNTVYTNGTSSYGIQLYQAGSNTVDFNTIGTNGSIAYGIYGNSLSTVNNFSFNTVRTQSGDGIQIGDSSSQLVSRNTVYANASSLAGIRIYAFGGPAVQNNIIENNLVQNNATTGYGIGVSCASDGGNCNSNTIQSNVVSTFGATGTGIRIENQGGTVDSTVVWRNSVNTTGSTSHGIYLAAANWANVTDNAVNTSGTTAHGVYIDGNSGVGAADGSNVSENAVYTYGAQAMGIYASASHYGNYTNNTVTTAGTGEAHAAHFYNSLNNTLSHNTFRPGAIGPYSLYLNGSNYTASSYDVIDGNGKSTMLNLTNSRLSTFTNDTIKIGSITSGVSVAVTLDSNATLTNTTTQINTEIPPKKISYQFGTANAITQKWYARANVTWTNSTPIVGAFVNVTNATNPATNPLHFNQPADSTGATGWLLVTEFIGNSTANVTYTPHNFTAYNLTAGTISNFNSTNASVTSTQTVWITLSSVPTTNCGPLYYTGATDGWNTLYTVGADLTAAGTCYTIAGNNVTLDCLGHRIRYAQTLNGSGVNFSTLGLDNVTIRGCIFDANSSVMNITTALNITGASGDYSNNITIYNNTLVSNGDWPFRTFNVLMTFVSNSNMSSNNVTHIAGEVALELEAVHNTFFASNNIMDLFAGYSAIGYGGTAYGNTFRANNITVTGGSTNGYQTGGQAVINNTFEYNLVFDTASPAFGNIGHPIWLRTSANNNTIRFNTINTTGTLGHGILVQGNNNILQSNTINTTGNLSSGIVLLGSSATGNVVIGNTINTTGVNSSGINLTTAPLNNITFNRVRTYGAESSALYARDSNFAIIRSNTLNATGSAAFALLLFASNGTNSSLNTMQANSGGVNSTRSSRNNTLEMDSIIRCGACASTYADFILEYDSNLTAVNATFNQSAVSWGSGTKNNLTIRWYARANVTWTNYTPIVGARVNITNATSAAGNQMHANLLVGSDGATAWSLVTQFEGNNTANFSYTPHNFTVVNYSQSAWQLNNTNATMNASMTVWITLSQTTPSSCGALAYHGAERGLNSLYTLSNDVASAGNCFTFTTPNITLDCLGYNVYYAQSGTGMGANFSTTGLDNITVQGCNFWENSTSANSTGIYFNGTPTDASKNITIYNNSFRTNSLQSVGVQIENSNQTNVTGNIFTTTGWGAVALNYSNSSYIWIATNVMTTNATNAVPIYFKTSNNYTNITGNSIVSNTSTGIQFGMYATGENITGNTIRINGSNSPTIYGIYISAGGTVGFGAVNISRNTIDINSTGAAAITISNGNTGTTMFVTGNVISTNGSGGSAISGAYTGVVNATSNTIVLRGATAGGINVAGNITGNRITLLGTSETGISGGGTTTVKYITENTIFLNNTGSIGISVAQLDGGIINNNTIQGNGTNAIAIKSFTSISGNTLMAIEGNQIKLNATGSQGIYESDGSGVNVSYNYIKTFGSQSYGIYVIRTTTQGFVNFSYNNILTNDSYAHGIYVAASSGTVGIINFTGNAISTNGTGAYGILLERATAVNFTNTTITSRAGAIASNGSYANQFVNGTINYCTAGCDANYFDVNLTGNSDLRLLNTTINQSAINWGAGLANNLTIQWYARANVTWTNSTPINGANVNVTNATSATTNPMFLNLVAGADGATPWWVVTQFFGNNTANVTYTPHNFSATNYSQGTWQFNGTNATVNRSQTVWVALTQVTPATSQTCGALAYRGAEEAENSLYTLTTDVASDANCFTITSPNVTLDCLGYNVFYAQTGIGLGVNFSAEGFDNITIRGCTFVQNGTSQNSSAIYLNGTGNNIAINLTIRNNTILTNGASSIGILFNNTRTLNITLNTVVTNGTTAGALNITNSSSVTIFANTLTANGSRSPAIGLRTTNSTNITANTLYTNGSNAVGINVGISSLNNWIISNTITTNGSSANGILFPTNAKANVTGNTIVTRGASAPGIATGSSSVGMMFNVTRNSITTWGDNSNGISIASSQSTPIITENTIVTNGTSSNGISDCGSTNGILSNNTIYTNGSSANALALSKCTSGNSDNVAEYNILITNGTSATALHGQDGTNNNISYNYLKTFGTSSYGIYLTSLGSAQQFVNYSYNNILTNGTSAHGIYGQTGTFPPADINFTGNAISTNGTGAYGVYMQDAYATNFTNTTITSRAGGIKADNALGNQFINGTINYCTAGCDAGYFDINMSTSSDLRLLNTTFNRSAVLWDVSANNNLTIDWFVRANVTWSNYTVIPGAYVNITNATSATTNPLLSNLVTDSTGVTGWFTVTQFIGNNTVNANYTPHVLTAVNYSNTNTTNATMNASQTVWITFSNNGLYLGSVTVGPATIDLTPGPDNTSIACWSTLIDFNGFGSATASGTLEETALYTKLSAYGTANLSLGVMNNTVVNDSASVFSPYRSNSFTPTNGTYFSTPLRPSGASSGTTLAQANWSWFEAAGLNAEDVVIASLHFENDTKDSSRFNNSGSLGNGTVAATPIFNNSCKIGGCFQFNGFNQFLRLKNGELNFNRTNEYTIAFWVKDNQSATNGALVEKWAGNGGYPFAFRSLPSGSARQVRFLIYNGTLNPGVTGGDISGGGWHHVAGVVNGTQLTNRSIVLYVDGTMVGSGNFTIMAGDINNSDLLSVGARGASSSFYNGSVDELHIWNRSLTSSEISQLIAWENNSDNRGNEGFIHNFTNVSLAFRAKNYTFNDSQLVGWWDLGDSSGNETEALKSLDLSGKGYIATFANTTNASLFPTLNTTSCVVGRCLDFGGVKRQIALTSLTIPAGWFNQSGVTYAAWVKTGSAVASSKAIVGQPNSEVSGNFYVYGGLLMNSSFKAGFMAYTGTVYQIAAGGPAINDNLWHFIVGQYNLTHMSVYVDGSLVNSTPYVDATWTTVPAVNVRIGSPQQITGSSNNYWDGSIDAVKIWNRSITAAEITALYGQGAPSNGSGQESNWSAWTQEYYGNGNASVTGAVGKISQFRASFNATSSNYSAFLKNVTLSFYNASYQRIGIYNASCSTVSANSTGGTANCSFQMRYFYPAGSWSCTVNASDAAASTASRTTTATVNTLVAITVNPSAVAFGTISPGGTSTAQSLNVTNWGNTVLDMTYQDTNLTGPTPNFRNITFDNIKYAWDTTMSDETAFTERGGDSTPNSSYDLAVATVALTSNRTHYFDLHVPSGIIADTYNGFIDFVASQS